MHSERSYLMVQLRRAKNGKGSPKLPISCGTNIFKILSRLTQHFSNQTEYLLGKKGKPGKSLEVIG
jgi:hypothetical protein